MIIKIKQFIEKRLKQLFIKNERDFDLIKSLPYYQNNVELVKEFPNE